MRTNIDIDDELMEAAQKASGQPTKKATVEDGLRTLIRLSRQQELLRLGGRFSWEGDLDQSRQGRRT